MLDWEGKMQQKRDHWHRIVLDDCVERWARINNLMAKDNFKLHGMTPHTVTLAEEGDKSPLWMV